MSYTNDASAKQYTKEQKLYNIITEKILDFAYETILEIDLKTGKYEVLKTVEHDYDELPKHGDFFQIVNDYNSKNFRYLSPQERENNKKAFDLIEIENFLKTNSILNVNYSKLDEDNILKRKMTNIFYIDIQERTICFAISDISEPVKIRQCVKKSFQNNFSVSKKEEENNMSLVKLSNNLKAPINTILEVTHHPINGSETAPQIQQDIEIIEGQTKQLLNIVDNIFDINLMENGIFPFSQKPFSLFELLEKVGGSFSVLFSEKHFKFKIFKENIVHKRLLGDETQIARIFYNLLLNAGMYTPNGGKISLRAKELPSPIEKIAYFSFVITDKGPGIDKTCMDRIFPTFDKNKNYENELTCKELGLNMVKAIVHSSGGSITIHSQKNTGTSIAVYLPILIDNSKEKPTSAN